MFVSSLSLCAELRRDLPPTTKFKSKQQENHGKNCKQTEKNGEKKLNIHIPTLNYDLNLN